MGSICEEADSALEKLKEQFERGWSGEQQDVKREILRPLITPKETFEEEFMFLKLFLDCIHHWSDAAEFVPDFVVLIEGVMKDFGARLEKSCSVEKASKLAIPFLNTKKKIELQNLQQWATRLMDVLYDLNGTIQLLKPDISQVYDSLSNYTFLSNSPMIDFGGWKKFVRSIEMSLKVHSRGVYTDNPVWEQSSAFIEHLQKAMNFVELLLKCFSDENKKTEELMIHVANVALRAGVLSCKYWLRPMDPQMGWGIITALSGLRQEIDLATPEFVDMNLKLLKTFRANKDSKAVNQVEMFVQYLLGSTMPDALYHELVSLITSVINIPDEEFTDDAQRFLADVKEVIIEVRSLDWLLRNEHSILELDLLAKIWHIKIEVFLRNQLTAYTFMLSVDEQVNVLNQGVKYLNFDEGQGFFKTYFRDLPEKDVENVKKILTPMEEVTRVVSSLNHSSQAQEITRNMVTNVFFKLLLKIMLFKVESFLMEHHKRNESLMIQVIDGVKCLHEELKFLSVLFVKNQPESSLEDGGLVFTHIQAVATGLIILCHSFRTTEITEELLKNMNGLISVLLDEIKLILEKLKQKYVPIPKSNFPKTNGLGFMDSFLRNLTHLLNYKADLFASVNHQIQEILGDLELLKSFLRNILEQDNEVAELKDLGARIVNVTYEAEYFIDLIVAGNFGEWHHSLWLYHLLEDIRLVKMLVTRIYEKKTLEVRVHNIGQTSTRHTISTANIQRIDEIVVGLNDQEEVIIDRLTGGFLGRDVVSIIGMPGIGKTTLTKKVYNSPRVVYHFHIRAWCCISQIYRKRELLLEILSHITALTENILAMTNEDLDLKLYQLLKQKTYLIVMDDVWNIGAWEDLERSFPNDGNGSRILITSRLHDVALKAKSQTDPDPHPLRLLSDVESWDLLQMKVFHEEGCPKELIEVGQQIAKNCKGLPLSVVAMAGLLERTDKKQEHWKQIKESLSSMIIDDPESRCKDILELSYKHLPDYLKACFIYFGAFPEDEVIPVQKMIRLWEAEGFIEKNGFKNSEDLAEDYLMDLIGRSLVIIAQRSSRGGVKAFRVHDMLRNLCLSKAIEEKFLQLITGSGDDYASLDGLDYGVDLDSNSPSTSITYEDHRLCIRSKRKNFVMSRPSGPCVRSLLFFATNDMYPRCPYDISFISHNFKLLKVLDLECINMGISFPKRIESLVLLTYLSVSGDVDFVPPSICNLWNLETFIVKGLKGKVKLPDTIWCMARLRHVHVSNSAIISLQDDKLGNSSQLYNLSTLSSLFLSCGEMANKILRQVPNLRKLRCIFSESRENSGDCNLFPRLDVLTQLESLKVSYFGRALHPGELMFPLNLKKLTLSNFRLPWNRISSIGKLPYLEVLKLVSRAFEGEKWDMIEGEFSKLKFLKLDTLNIAKWNASSYDLPNLQQLVLQCCKHLEEVPYSFWEIPTLQRIEVQWCGDSAEESVRKIREEADERLKVFILSDSEFRSSS